MGRDVPTFLIVDDDPSQRQLLASFLGGSGYDVVVAGGAAEALERLAEGAVSMVISDIRMPKMSGLEMLAAIRESDPGLPVLLVTAYADVKDAIGAVRSGAVDYLEKPIDFDELLTTVRACLGLTDEEADAIPELPQLPDDVIAVSSASRAVFRDVALVAPTESRVLLTGESGTGKEVLTGLLHQWSPRADQPLVCVNCAAIPPALIESELFGHEKGAFTGATEQRVGRFEEAGAGTIFLDEIGELPFELQAKLLRVTQDGTFHRVGSNRQQTTNARLVAATNRDLEKEVAEGRFREDLFYRLTVFELYIPPLRERPEDILPLAEHFAALHTRGGRARLSPAVVTALTLYRWPGNVRELQNAMERASLLARGSMILPEHLPRRIQDATQVGRDDGTGDPKAGRMEEMERAVILQTLRQHDYNRSESARVLGISRRALIYKLQRYGAEGYQVDP